MDFLSKLLNPATPTARERKATVDLEAAMKRVGLVCSVIGVDRIEASAQALNKWAESMECKHADIFDRIRSVRSLHEEAAENVAKRWANENPED